MTTQNWPDPKRPGVPMFSDRDGAHVFENENDEDLHLVYHWNSEKQCWSDFPVNTTNQWDLNPNLQDYKYVGPVLTPAQINETMAAERDRCADACRAMSFDNHYTKTQRDALEEVETAIRNLGAAP